MTDAEEATAVAAPAPKETKDVKPKLLKKPVKPDEGEYKKQMEALQEQITNHRARMDEVQRLLSGRRMNNETPEMKALRNKLNALRAEWQTALDVKKAARAELDTISSSREAVRAQIRTIRDKMKVATVEKIDEQVAHLERQMQQTSMSLAEEKATMEQIKQLKASRGTVAEYNQKMTQLSQDEAVKDGVMQRLKGADERLNAIKTEQDSIRAHLDELREAEAAATADIPTLQEERVEVKAVIDAAYNKKRELYTEFKTRMDAWREEEKQWRAQRDEDRKRRQEQQQKEYDERQAARKAQEAEMAGEPFQREIDCCDQLTHYLSQYVIKESSTVAAPATDASVESRNIDGYKLLGRKKEEDFEPMFGGLAPKKGKKKGKNKKNVLEEEDAAERLLMHSLDIMDAFSRMKLDLPLTVGDAPASIEALKEKKAYYLERQRKKKAGEEDPDDAADAAEAAAAKQPKDRGAPKGSKKPDLAATSFPALGASSAAAATNGTAVHDEEEEEGGEKDADEGAEAGEDEEENGEEGGEDEEEEAAGLHDDEDVLEAMAEEVIVDVEETDENAAPVTQNQEPQANGTGIKVKVSANEEGTTAVAVDFKLEC